MQSTESNNRHKRWLSIVVGIILAIGVVLIVTWSRVARVAPPSVPRGESNRSGVITNNSAKLDWYEALGTNVNKRINPSGSTPLMQAAMSGNLEAAQKLIAKGADVNLADIRGRTALYWAACFEDNPTELMVLLMKHGADVNITDKDGMSILDCARSNSNFVELLRRAGATSQWDRVNK